MTARPLPTRCHSTHGPLLRPHYTARPVQIGASALPSAKEPQTTPLPLFHADAAVPPPKLSCQHPTHRQTPGVTAPPSTHALHTLLRPHALAAVMVCVAPCSGSARARGNAAGGGWRRERALQASTALSRAAPQSAALLPLRPGGPHGASGASEPHSPGMATAGLPHPRAWCGRARRRLRRASAGPGGGHRCMPAARPCAAAGAASGRPAAC
jgi:hypothetical protein